MYIPPDQTTLTWRGAHIPSVFQRSFNGGLPLVMSNGPGSAGASFIAAAAGKQRHNRQFR